MSRRQFAVRCAPGHGSSVSEHVDTLSDAATPIAERLRADLLAGGLEDVVVVPDAQGEGLTIRGLAPAESKQAARSLVEDLINGTLDLTMLEPGVWVDDGIRR